MCFETANRLQSSGNIWLRPGMAAITLTGIGREDARGSSSDG